MTDLVLNPSFRFSLADAQPGGHLEIRTWAPQRPGAVEGQLVVARDSELANFFQRLRFDDTGQDLEIELSETALDRLHALGFLVDPSSLSVQPRLEGPASFGEPAASGGRLPEDYVIDPTLRCGTAEAFVRASGRTPDTALLAVLPADRPLVWARQPGTNLLDLLAPPPEVLAELCEGGSYPAALSPRARAWLLDAGLLCPRGEFERREAERQEEIEVLRERFDRERYVVIPAWSRAAYISTVGRYARAVVDEGFATVERVDGRVNRRIRHREPLGEMLHGQWASTMEAIVGRSIKPSYSLFASYATVADLPMHTDREQCEYTLSIAVEARGSSGEAASWPLEVDCGSGRRVSVRLGIGDAILFKGRELPHGRARLEVGEHTSMLLHFVNDDFLGSLD